MKLLRSRVFAAVSILILILSFSTCKKERPASYTPEQHKKFALWLTQMELANGDYEYFLDKTSSKVMLEILEAASSQLKRKLSTAEKDKLEDALRISLRQIYPQKLIAERLAPLYQEHISAESLILTLQFFETPAGQQALNHRHAPELIGPNPDYQLFADRYLGKSSAGVLLFFNSKAGREFAKSKALMIPKLESSFKKLVKAKLPEFQKRFKKEFEDIF